MKKFVEILILIILILIILTKTVTFKSNLKYNKDK